jgi:hypothetical protein
MMAIPKNPMFPRKINDRIGDFHTKFNYLSLIAKRAGMNIPDEVIAVMAQLIYNVDQANIPMMDTDNRMKQDRIRRNATADIAQMYIRRVINYYIVGNPAATNGDYESLRVERKGYHPPLPAPVSPPGVRRIYSQDMCLYVELFNSATMKRAKPSGVSSIEMYYQLGGEEPKSVTQLTERLIATSSPLMIKFSSDDEMQRVYTAFRWIGTKGDYSPWTKIYCMVLIR